MSIFIFFFFISLARQCAQLWLKTRESLGHPLGIASDPVHVVCPKELLDAAAKKVSLHLQLI
jgi:glycyl-tRNA synthetase